MKDNEINRAKWGCALEPSHLNIRACVSSLQSRDFRTQLAPIKRYHTGRESCHSPGLLSAPSPLCRGEAGELHLHGAIASWTHSVYTHSLHPVLLKLQSSLHVSGTKAVQFQGYAWYSRQSSCWKHNWFLNHLLKSALSRAATTAASPPTWSQLSFSSLSPLAMPHEPPWQEISMYVYIYRSHRSRKVAHPPCPSDCDRDLVRLFLLSVLGKAKVSTLPCWSLPLRSAWFTK